MKYCEKYFAEIQVYYEAGVMVTGMESEGKHPDFESWLLDLLALSLMKALQENPMRN